MRTAIAANVAESRKAWSITVNTSTRACINCKYYELYYHRERGNVCSWVPTATGYCLLHERERGALRQPCKDFLKHAIKTKAPR